MAEFVSVLSFALLFILLVVLLVVVFVLALVFMLVFVSVSMFPFVFVLVLVVSVGDGAAEGIVDVVEVGLFVFTAAGVIKGNSSSTSLIAIFFIYKKLSALRTN